MKVCSVPPEPRDPDIQITLSPEEADRLMLALGWCMHVSAEISAARVARDLKAEILLLRKGVRS